MKTEIKFSMIDFDELFDFSTNFLKIKTINPIEKNIIDINASVAS